MIRFLVICTTIALLLVGLSSLPQRADVRFGQADNPSLAAVETPDVSGDWTGEWGPFNPASSSEINPEHCKLIECHVSKKDNVWHATFEGECGRPYKYEIQMQGAAAGESVLFQGTADLGPEDGGVYHWIGRATETEFIGFYTSAGYAGFFKMTKKN